jgi:hypothetical protein
MNPLQCYDVHRMLILLVSAYPASCHLKVDFLCDFSVIIPANAVSQKYYEYKVFSKQRPVQYITYREHWQVSATCRLVLG